MLWYTRIVFFEYCVNVCVCVFIQMYEMVCECDTRFVLRLCGLIVHNKSCLTYIHIRMMVSCNRQPCWMGWKVGVYVREYYFPLKFERLCVVLRNHAIIDVVWCGLYFLILKWKSKSTVYSVWDENMFAFSLRRIY